MITKKANNIYNLWKWPYEYTANKEAFIHENQIELGKKNESLLYLNQYSFCVSLLLPPPLTQKHYRLVKSTTGFSLLPPF